MKQLDQIMNGAFEQFRHLWRILFLYVYLPIAIFFLVLGISRYTGQVTSFSIFFRDVTATCNLPFYTGIVSQLGGLFWCATTTACFLAFFLIKGLKVDSFYSQRFLLQAAILSVILLFDDLFLFHEEIAPVYFYVEEGITLVVYMALILLFIIFNRDEILSSEYSIFGLALVLFGLSIVTDFAREPLYFDWGPFWRGRIFLEDGAKFIGVITWFVYFARYSYHRMLLGSSLVGSSQ